MQYAKNPIKIEWKIRKLPMQNIQFPAIHFNFLCIFIDSSVELENRWFWKKSVHLALKLRILLAIQYLQEVN